MKPIIGNLCRATALCALFLGGFTACNSKDEAVDSAGKQQEVVFLFDAKKVMETKAIEAVTDPVLCDYAGQEMTVDITLTGPAGTVEIVGKSVSLFGSNFKTAPILLPSGNYTVESVIIYSGENVFYAGVLPAGAFSAFIPEGYLMGEQSFTVTNFTKPTVILYVLCARGEKATDFGMPKFQINKVEVNCFDLFFNVCDPEQGGEHIVGSGVIELWSADGNELIYRDAYGSGNIATICFADDKNIADNTTEIYKLVVKLNPPVAQTIVATISVADLLKFKESPSWNDQMNAIHVVYCGGTPFCIPLPGVICGGPDPDPDPECDGLAELYDNFNYYTAFDQLFSVGPWAIFNGASLGIPSLDASLGLQTESNNGKNKQYSEMSFVAGANDATHRIYTFQTKRFKFNQLDNIAFEHWLRSVRIETPNDRHKFIAKATLELWDDFSMVATKIDYWSTPDSDPLSATGNGDWHYVPAPKYGDPFPSDLVKDGCYYLKIIVEIMPVAQKNGDPVIFEAGRTYYLGIDNLVKYTGENPNQI